MINLPENKQNFFSVANNISDTAGLHKVLESLRNAIIAIQNNQGFVIRHRPFKWFQSKENAAMDRLLENLSCLKENIKQGTVFDRASPTWLKEKHNAMLDYISQYQSVLHEQGKKRNFGDFQWFVNLSGKIRGVVSHVEFGDGSWYSGGFKDGLRHGYGIWCSVDGEKVYAGYFRKGHYEGKGVYCDMIQGIRMEGEWKNNRLNGKGALTYMGSKHEYRGSFVDGKRHGFGTEIHESGERYDGWFEKGKRHGYGIYFFFEDNHVYKGYFLKDQMSGTGTYTGHYECNGKNVFIEHKGEFLRNEPHGACLKTVMYERVVDGVKRFCEFGVFKGNYCQGSLHGTATIKLFDQVVCKAIYDKGKVMESGYYVEDDTSVDGYRELSSSEIGCHIMKMMETGLCGIANPYKIFEQ